MASARIRRTVWGAFIAIASLLLFGLLGPLIPRKQVSIWVCPITGSTRTEVVWFWHFRHEERTVTALETWLKRQEPGFEPNWQHLSTQTHFIAGTSFACAKAPAIYQLCPFLDLVVGKLSDEQIAGFVTVLRHGSPEEQRQIVQKIADEVFAKDSTVMAK
jgi:hypothetical protein